MLSEPDVKKKYHKADGAGGGTRTPTGKSPTDFLTSYGFRRPRDARFVVWTIPSPWRVRFRCCPSSLYTFPAFGRAWLGIAISQVSPNLGSSASQVSLKALFDRLPTLQIAEKPAYLDNYHFHGFERLLVTW